MSAQSQGVFSTAGAREVVGPITLLPRRHPPTPAIGAHRCTYAGIEGDQLNFRKFLAANGVGMAIAD